MFYSIFTYNRRPDTPNDPYVTDEMVEINNYVPLFHKSYEYFTSPVGVLNEYLKKAHTDYLVRKLKMGKDFFDGDYVVCQENGKPYKPNSFTDKFNNFLKKNKLKHIRLHDLRHTNATLMLTQGISPKVAQMRLGHSDYSTTMNIYSHVLKSVETEAAEKIENAIFSSIAK